MHRAGPRQPSSRSKYSPVHEHKSIALCSWSLAPERNAYSFTPLTLLPSIDALANPTPTAVLLPTTSDTTSSSNLRSPSTPPAAQTPIQSSSSSTLSQSLTQSGSQRGAKPPLRSSSSLSCNGIVIAGPPTLHGNGNVKGHGTGGGSSSPSSCKPGSLRLTPAKACTLRSRSTAAATSSSPITTTASSTGFFPTRKSASSPLLADFQSHPPPPPYSESRIPPLSYTHQPLWKNASPVIPSPPTNLFTSTYMHSDTEDDDEMIYTSRLRPHSHSGSNSNSHSHSSTSLRSRIFGLASTAGGSGGHSRGRSDRDREQGKLICTTPGERCAGETETETDEPSRHLPTARIIPSSGPLIPPHTLQQTLTPFLFEFARFLSVVPAIFGTIYNLYHIYAPPPPLPPNISGRPPADRLDFFVAALWAILTGYQCLALATGLLTRWRLYYAPLSTLVRLLALQGICWQATHLSLSILDGLKRPVVTWAVVGTTTCISRSVQIWVTSNLWWEVEGVQSSEETTNLAGLSASVAALAGLASSSSPSSSYPPSHPSTGKTKIRGGGGGGGYWKRVAGGTWGGRRWDWREVGIHCMLPAGILYFIMAWAEQVRREWVVPVPSC